MRDNIIYKVQFNLILPARNCKLTSGLNRLLGQYNINASQFCKTVEMLTIDYQINLLLNLKIIKDSSQDIPVIYIKRPVVYYIFYLLCQDCILSEGVLLLKLFDLFNILQTIDYNYYTLKIFFSIVESYNIKNN